MTDLSRENRRARLAVSLLFFTNGAMFANILPRFPEIKGSLELSNAVYGIAVTGFPIGAIVAGLAAAGLIRRFGSARVAVVSTALMGAGLILASLSMSVWWFGLALLAAGAMDAITDVAQNAHGLRVQRRFKRSILNSFHAVWSIGSVTGGAMSAAAIALQIPLGVHLTVSSILFAVVSLLALRLCLPGLDEATDELSLPEPGDLQRSVKAPFSLRTVLILAALTGIAIANTVVEDAGNSWAALYLTTLDAPGSIAALGFIALVGAQFIGRLIGDSLVDRFGQRAVARAGGALVAVGMSLALLFPSVPGTIAGFAAAGLGIATLVPAAMSEAERIPGLRRGTGLTIVSWLMRLGFLLAPPFVGFLADTFSLQVGLIVMPAAGLAVVLLAGVLRKREH